MAELFKTYQKHPDEPARMTTMSSPDGKYKPTADELELARFVFSKYKDAKEFKKNYDKDWDKWYKLYSGLHWDAKRPEWKSDPVINFIFSTIETIIPIMTDSAPQITVVPTQQDDAAVAEVLSALVRRVWQDEKMQVKLVEILKNALKYGTGFAKVWWNSELKDGMGDVAISPVDPRHIFPSPGALDLDSADHVIYAANMTIGAIERQYPEAKGKIEAGVWDEDLTVAKTITSQGGSDNSMKLVGPIATTDGAKSSWAASGSQASPVYDREKMATVVEYWFRNDEGRVWVTVMANGILLRNTESPFKHNRFPFIRFVDYVVPSCFWGMGETQQLEKLQDFINKRRAQTQDILRITASPPLVADADSGVNPKAMITRPGVIIFKNRGTDVKWMQPPLLPAALFEVQELDKRDFDSISGVHDVQQGRRPTGIEAGAAIEALQEAGQIRIRLKVRNMEVSLQEMGRQIVSLQQQFYTTPRVVRLVSNNPANPKFVEINREVLDEKTGAIQRFNDISVGEYDVEIGIGSTMPINKTKRYEEMVEMYGLGIVDAQAVLEHSSLAPEEQNRILMRMAQKEQQLMAMQTGQPLPPEAGGAPTPGAAPPATEGAQGAPPTEEELQAILAETMQASG